MTSSTIYMKIDVWWQSHNADYITLLKMLRKKPTGGWTPYWSSKKIEFAIWLGGSDVVLLDGLMIEDRIDSLLSTFMYYSWDRQERKVRLATKNYAKNREVVDQYWAGECYVLILQNSYLIII